MPNEFVLIAGWDRKDYRLKRRRVGNAEGKSREWGEGRRGRRKKRELKEHGMKRGESSGKSRRFEGIM